MCYRITITNLKTQSDAVIKFTTPEKADKFLKQLTCDVYASKNRHIRSEPPPCQDIVSQHVIYTSREDIERIVVRQYKK